jgi:hypothetical protein
MNKEKIWEGRCTFNPRSLVKTIHHHPLHSDWHGVIVQEFFNLFKNSKVIRVEKEDDTTLGQELVCKNENKVHIVQDLSIPL